MKRLLSSVAAVALAAGFATSASAAPFDGPYVGVQGGWSQNDLGTPTTPLGDLDVDRKQDSVSGGAFLGYDHRVGERFVLGAEAGIQAGADDEVVRTSGGSRITVDPKRSLDLTARAGYLVSDDTLLYARGGYTNAKVRTSVSDAAGFRTASQNRDGWLVGGGLEHALSDDVSARAEYRYSDFGDGGSGFDRHQALFGLSFRF